MTKRLLAATLTIGSIVGASVVGFAAPAYANTWSQYCGSVVYSTQYPVALNSITECRLQGGPAATGGRDFRYTGPVDGEMGINSWKGMQSFLKDRWGYGGPIDGVPGTNTHIAMQKWAKAAGFYGGSYDGVADGDFWYAVNRTARLQYFSD